MSTIATAYNISSSFWWCKKQGEMSRVVVFCWCFRFVQSQCDVLPRLLYVVLCWVIVCQIFGRHVMYMCAASSQSSFVPYRIKWTRLDGATNNWNSRQIESISNVSEKRCILINFDWDESWGVSEWAGWVEAQQFLTPNRCSTCSSYNFLMDLLCSGLLRLS